MFKKMLTVSAMALSLFVIGCGTTDPTTTTATVTLGEIGTLTAGSNAPKSVTGSIKADEIITNVTYAIVDASDKPVSSTLIPVSGTAANNKKDLDITVTIEAKTGAISGSYNLKITVTAGVVTSTTKPFTVTGVAANPVVSADVTLGAHDNATLGSSLDLDAGTVMLAAAARADGSGVDIVYTYSSTAPGPVLMSPTYAKASSGITAFAAWVNPFDTKFHKVTTTGVTYESITTDVALKALYNETLATAGRLVVAVGDLVVVKTSAGKYALIKIVTVSSDATGSASIKFAK
jgi:hypothetical protein